MCSARPDEDDTLVVPVDVAGLCVGTDDVQQATGRFAGATVAYDRQQTPQFPAYLGSNVTRDFSDRPGSSSRRASTCTGRCPTRYVVAAARARS